MSELYIGLLSGTSADGIDAALVDFTASSPQVIHTQYTAYAEEVREKIFRLYQPGENEIQRLGELDVILGEAFAQAALSLLTATSLPTSAIKAIGSHGQNIRHHPRHHPHPFTLQVADPNIIAVRTGITTIADFRRKDIALGGQGAPLAPAFHQQILSSSTEHRAIVNIGGIANITLLTQNTRDRVIGFDTGPGNALLDAWINYHEKKSHDMNGAWAAQGQVQNNLLKQLLSDPYFQLPTPKSTGREYFNLAWLKQHLSVCNENLSAIDVQATLVELTATSILTAIQHYLTQGEILICGGGVHNAHLMARLKFLANPHFRVASTKQYGVDPDWIEAMLFAWLAQQTLLNKPGNLTSVTGAQRSSILGGIYYA